jgi:DNA-binding PadR family transcriptional regulator
LFILSTLAENGPMHGHKMLLQAQEDRAELWTDIRVSALYGAIKRLAREGLVAEVRNEKAGNFPERTVFDITAEGRRALNLVHDQALRSVVLRPDPFDLALARFGDIAPHTLEEVVSDRLQQLVAQRSALGHQQQSADQWLTEAERAVLDHVIGRLDGEILWHRSLIDRIPAIIRDRENRQGEPT